ncbi:DUF1707 SHOCT-like domain-containing protein [Streptomyces sp. 1331.2]|uniref:DUF1707 SHOCT-like domain-containing protein n=1 Tax=Streptomyces sp. 1331.2 TaxID=1938835 RepID=UPI000BDD3E6F|nr:DUF1707 domain-containing protein [Streptomyces sp. 1331.2]SOB82303.1 Cell wall-active antibiotics response 4TMS YvqF [Streptomyces sp. 1331.2]
MDNSPSHDDPGQPPVPAPVPMTKSEAEPKPHLTPEPKPDPAPGAASSHAPVAQAEMRVSDADRERVAELLRDAYAEGRLDADEHAERIEAAYAAKTFGELAPLTRDLPARPLSFEKQPLGAAAPAAPPQPPARQESPSVVAIFGGASRKGRWRVGSHLKAFAAFGGVEIDLSDAVFESPEVEIVVMAMFGGVEVRVPENVSLHGGGLGLFGGFDVREQTAADPYAPVVRVKGLALFGGCTAKPRQGKKIKEWVRRQLGTE